MVGQGPPHGRWRVTPPADAVRGRQPRAPGPQPRAWGPQPHAPALEPHAPGSTPHAPGRKAHARGPGPHAPASKPHARASRPHARGSRPHAQAREPHARASRPHAWARNPHARGREPRQPPSRLGFSHRSPGKRSAPGGLCTTELPGPRVRPLALPGLRGLRAAGRRPARGPGCEVVSAGLESSWFASIATCPGAANATWNRPGPGALARGPGGGVGS